MIPLDERDLGLAGKLELELDAVLAFVVNGYQDWRQRGLDDPEQVVQATQEYREESDALGRFIEQRCLAGHGSCASAELFAAWSKWCAREGIEPGTATAFATLLQNKGFDNYTSNGRRRWRSLSLNDEDPRGEGWPEVEGREGLSVNAHPREVVKQETLTNPLLGSDAGQPEPGEPWPDDSIGADANEPGDEITDDDEWPF